MPTVVRGNEILVLDEDATSYVNLFANAPDRLKEDDQIITHEVMLANTDATSEIWLISGNTGGGDPTILVMPGQGGRWRTPVAGDVNALLWLYSPAGTVSGTIHFQVRPHKAEPLS